MADCQGYVAAVPEATPTQLLAGVLLQEPLHEVVRRLRTQGLSWQGVADRIANDTDGIIDLNRETYRLWFGIAHDPAVSRD